MAHHLTYTRPCKLLDLLYAMISFSGKMLLKWLVELIIDNLSDGDMSIQREARCLPETIWVCRIADRFQNYDRFPSVVVPLQWPEQCLVYDNLVCRAGNTVSLVST